MMVWFFDELMMVFVMMLDDIGGCWLLVVVNPTRPASSSLISSPGATRSPNYQLLGRSADEIWEDFFLPLSFPWDFLVMLEHVGCWAEEASLGGYLVVMLSIFRGCYLLFFWEGIVCIYLYIYLTPHGRKLSTLILGHLPTPLNQRCNENGGHRCNSTFDASDFSELEGCLGAYEGEGKTTGGSFFC